MDQGYISGHYQIRGPATKNTERAATMAEMSRQVCQGQTHKPQSPAGDAEKVNKQGMEVLTGGPEDI